MKRFRFCFVLAVTLLFTLSVSLPVYANMAAPEDPDIGTAITFEKNDAIAVRSEVLDINVDGTVAYITATYGMENTTDEAVSTPAMFIAPNMGGGSVVVDGADTPITTKSYTLSYDTEINSEDWKYAVLSGGNGSSERTADTITFTMHFEPGETYDVVVSYTYHLGGWPGPEINPASRAGEIEYYLAPAAMWKDFEHLTINLHLDRNLPNITESNFPFEKVGRRSYQCVLDRLPVSRNLSLTLGPSRVLAAFGNLGYMSMIFLPFLFPIIIILLAVILYRISKKKPKK